MTTVNITEFVGYDLDEFREFLETENDGVFEIFIPKETVQFNSTNEDISWDFALAAYIGQKLNELSESFSYSGVLLANVGKFIYNTPLI